MSQTAHRPVLIDSVKPIRTTPLVDASDEEEFSDMDKELYTPEEAYDMTMKDIKAIYDPETGEYLNDETMQAIEDVRSGKEPVYEMKSMDEFKAWCEAL